MESKFFTIRSRAFTLIMCLMIGIGVQRTQAQYSGNDTCESIVPTFTVNLVGQPSGSFLFSDAGRNGICCSASHSNNCIHFILTLDSNAIAISLTVISGSTPSGSLYYQVDCGTQTNPDIPICISNPTHIVKTYDVTYCKPGGNNNSWSLNSVAGPSGVSVSVNLGCRDTLKSFGFKPSTITWTSISPGSPGQYNSLLSCTTCTNPIFTPVSASPSSIQYRVCGKANATAICGIDTNVTYCDTVTATVLPRWSNVPDQNICQPATTASLGAAPSGATWSFVSGPAVATIGSSTGSITGMSANGAYTFVLAKTNGLCTDTVVVTRSAKPNAGADQSICQPQTTASLGAAGGGESWSFITGPVTATINSVSGAVTGMTAVGNYVFLLSNSACSDTVIVTIKAQPATPTASNNGPLCVGATLNLTASTVAGATYSWSGPPSGTFSSSSQNPSIVSVTTSNAGTYSVSAIINSCPSVPGTTTVVINTVPSAPSVSSNSPVCEGDTIKLTAVGAGGASYNWVHASDGFTSTQQNPVRPNATSAMAGSYCATQTVSGCASVQACTSVTVNPKPSIQSTVGTNPTTCAGNNGSILVCGLTAGVQYQITYTKNSVAQTPVIANANGGGCINIPNLTAGTYFTFVAQATATGCTSDTFPSSTILTDPSTPSAPAVSSNSPVCEGDTLKLFATGQGGATYSWTGPGFSSSLQNPVRPNADLTMDNAPYFVTQTVAGCTSPAASISVTINPKPVIGSTSSSNPTTCSGTSGTITLGGLNNNVSYQVSYKRNGVTVLATIPSNGSGQVIITGLNAATYSNFVVTLVSTSCVSDTFSGPIVLTDPNTPAAPSVSSNSPVCEGDTLKLFATGAGGASYLWSASNCGGFGSSQQNPIRLNATLAYSCNYCATQTVAGCTSPQACVPVTVNARPVIGGITSSNPTTCGGSDGCVYLNGLSPSTLYSVRYQRNNVNQGPLSISTNISGQLPICGLNAATYDDFFVTLLGCESNAFGGSVTLTDPNPPSAPNVGGTASVCTGNTICLTASGSGGATYSWTGPCVYTSTTQNPCISNAVSCNSGNYCVTQTVANCTSSPACILVTVNPNPVAHAGNTQSVCSGNCVSIGDSPAATGGTPGYTYSWSVPSNVQHPIVCPTTNTVYTLTVTDSKGCTATDNTLVTVNANPVADAGADQTLVACSGSSVNIGGGPTATGGQGPYSFSWSPAAGLTSTTTSNPSVSNIGSTTCYTVTVTDNNGCSATDDVCVAVTGGSYSVVIIPNTSLKWCAETMGNVTFTALVFGGNSPYTYDWSGADLDTTGGPQVTASPSIPGTYQYNLVVTDATGCVAGDTIDVTVFPTPVADAGFIPDTVCAGAFVTLGGNPTASGGTAPYNYIWTGGAGTDSNPVIQVFSSSIYLLTVTDAHGCIDTSSKRVDVHPKPSADAGGDPKLPSCSPTGVQLGGSPCATGGTPPYTYSWSPTIGLSNATICAPMVCCIPTDTTYTLVVTDFYGCTASDQVFVDVVNTTPVVSISASPLNSWCANSGASTNLTANVSSGNPGFSYNWSGQNISPTNAATVTVNPQAPNSYIYTVVVTDAANCTATAAKTITVHPNPVADAGAVKTICSGECDTIGGAPTASGGTGAYTYLWSNGATTANPVVCPTSTTIYRVTVTDASACTATAATAVIVKPVPVANAGLDKTISSCSPTPVTIGASPTASGGNGAPYTYAWAGSPPSSFIPNATDPNPSVLPATTTTYTVTVTDVAGCSASDQMNVNVISATPSVSISADKDHWCTGSGTSTNLTASTSGGTGNFTYSWSGGTSPTNTAVVSVNPNSVGAHLYTVIVTDAANCTASASITITVNPNPSANAGPIDTICSGECVTIGFFPVATGGTPGYTYSWSGVSGGASNPSVCPLTTTTYVVTVTDSKTCTATSATTVIVNQNPLADAGADKTIINCNGDSIVIGGSPTGVGGSGSYTYTWSPSTGLNSASAANPVVKGIASNTTYCVTVTDVVTSCTSADCVFITVVPSSLQASAATGKAYCAGSVPVTDVGGSPTASGGRPPYSYSWSGSGLSCTTCPNPTAQPSSTTTYCVVVTDASGCTATACMTITANPKPTANAGNDTAVCSGSCVIIGSNPTGSGGTAPLSYTWTPGTGLNSSSIANPTACPGITTSYCLTVSDANSCSATDCMSITVNPSPVACAADFSLSVTTCAGDSVQLGCFPSASGGTSPLTCSWSIPSGGTLSNAGDCNPYYFGNTPGIYFDTLTVTDANGCKDADVARITVSSGSIQVDAGPDATICAGSGSVVILGGFDVVLGGEAPYTFAWSSTPPGFSSNLPHPQVSPTVTTTYCLTVTDANGCSAADCATITVSPAPVVNAGPDTTICAGNSVQIGGNPTSPGGQFEWGTGSLSCSTCPNPFVTPLSTTTYCVTVTNAAGCTASDCITVTVRQNPVADAGGPKSMVACSGACVQIGGVPTGSGGGGILSYLWSPPTNPPTSPNPVVCNLGSSAVYCVTVTDQFACSASSCMQITVTNPTLIACAGNNVSFCQGSSVCVTLGCTPSASGGTPPYRYSWSSVPPSPVPNVANPVVCPTVTTTYDLVVTDTTGCVAVSSVKITVNPRPVVGPFRDITICEGECTQIGGNPTAVGGSGQLTYSWSPGTGLNCPSCANPTVCPVVTTSYCVTVTDSLGCSASACQAVIVNPKPVADAGIDKPLVDCQGACIQIGGSPSASGGSGNYSYQWLPCLPPANMNSCTIPNPVICRLTTTTTFTLIVTDNATGCMDSDQMVVTVTASNLEANAGCDKVYCYGANASCITIGGGGNCGNPTAIGGLPPYTYQWGPGVVPPLSTPCVKPTVTTTYCVTVTDANGCTATDCMSVVVDPQLLSRAGNDTLICPGTCVVLGKNPAAVGGTPPYTYDWSAGVVPNNIPNPTVCPVASSCYTLTVTDSLGCAVPNTVCVSVRARPFADAGQPATLVACSGDSVILGGNPSATGTVGPYTCLWDVSGFFNVTDCNPVLDSLGHNQRFCLTVTDAFGCQSLPSCVDITAVPNTLFPDVGCLPSLCANNLSCVNLGGCPQGNAPSVTGGFPPYTYNWYAGGSTTPFSGVQHPNVCPTATTIYTLVVTDQHNCTAADQDSIVVNQPPTASITGLNPQYCINTPPVTLTGSPGPGLFYVDGVLVGTFFNPASVGLGSHSVKFIYTAPTGCKDTVTQNVLVNDTPQVTVTGITSLCKYDKPDTLTGTPSGGQFTPQGNGLTGNIFDPSSATVGIHIIKYTYTDQQTGCSGSKNISITVNAAPVTFFITTTGNTVCRGGSTTLTAHYSVAEIANNDIEYLSCSGNVSLATGNVITLANLMNDTCVIARAYGRNGCIKDTTINIHVNLPPVAVADTVATCEDSCIIIDVLANDSDPEEDSSFVSCASVLHGTTVIANNKITYCPVKDFNGLDTVTYCICNAQCPNDCDTALVYISICSVNDAPVIVCAPAGTCRDSALTITPSATDADGDPITYSYINCGTANGTVADNLNGTFTYTPAAGFFGTATVCFAACDTAGACDTCTMTITVNPCNHKPDAQDDNVQRQCDVDSVSIKALTNDSDPDNDSLFITQIIQPPAGQGTAVIVQGSFITYHPGTDTGIVQFRYVICDNGTPSLCDTATVSIHVVHCEVDITPSSDTVCHDSVQQSVNLCVNKYVTSTNPWTITSVCQPQNGTAAIASDSCITYTPNASFIGTDVFCIKVCDGMGHCDSANVSITILDCFIKATDEPCDLTETPLNTPVRINVLDNDIIPAATDTAIYIPPIIEHGTATEDDHTITVIPATDYEGEIKFQYVVCTTTGSFTQCDTADICVTVKDTTCFIPNAFSPNGDNANDIFTIKCNDNYPKSTLRIFDRWGVEVWHSNGHYLNDFAGKNMQGTELPDGTYYLIYDYNDGVHKPEAKFVVIMR